MFEFGTHALQLVRDLGSDLEQFRKLTRLQMAEVSCGLVCAGFVNFFLAPEVIQESPAELQGKMPLHPDLIALELFKC
jgi:hypothetical protein